MRKHITRTIHLSGYVFWGLLALALVYLIFAQPQLRAQILSDERGRIVAPNGTDLDVYYVLENSGLKPALVENVYLYDTQTDEPLRLSESFPKHQFWVWPKDEKIVRLSVKKLDKSDSVTVGLDVAYQTDQVIRSENTATIVWE